VLEVPELDVCGSDLGMSFPLSTPFPDSARTVRDDVQAGVKTHMAPPE